VRSASPPCSSSGAAADAAGAGYIDARVRSVRALAALAPRLGRRLRAATE